MPFLEIKNLTYTYPGGVRAVDRLDLTMERGEFVSIIGPNAAGKSTLALLVSGILQPESGTVSIGGVEREPGVVDPVAGLLFSNPENQLVTSIVEEDVAFGLEARAVPPEEIRNRVTTIMAELGIGHLKDRMPHRLSGGEQQMTALAGILVTEPELLILDEPTAYLDPVARAAVMRVVESLTASGVAVLLVTHDMERAAAADRVVLMDRGRVVLTGCPGELFADPRLSDVYGIHPPFSFRLASAALQGGIGQERRGNMCSLEDAMAAFAPDGDTQGRRDTVAGEPAGEPASHPAGGTPLLRLSGVSYSYPGGSRGSSTLRDLHLDVPEGSLTLLCGPNGSGKSTLLQMTNGLIRPDTGRVLFRGEDLEQYRRRRGGIPSRVALLFQNPERQLFSETVYEDVAFGPRNLGLEPEEVGRRVLNALQWVGLDEDVAARSIYTLSGGQMRRAAIAGVLAMEPDLLVLDEPTDGLDPPGVREFYTRARSYCDSTGAAILLATHALPDYVALADHVVHIESGRVMSAGPPARVLTGPGSTFPDAFLPSHLAVRRELGARGVSFEAGDLSPDKVLERIATFLGG